MKLFNPDRHFTLNSVTWSAQFALDESHRIMRDAAAAYSRESFWKSHSLDNESGTMPFLQTVYFGVPGCAWALGHWSRVTGEKLPSRFDPVEVLKKWNDDEEFKKKLPEGYPPSLFFGELGDRLAYEALSPSSQNRGKIDDLIRHSLEIKIGDSSGELMAGTPGALVAAIHLAENGSPDEQRRRLIRSHIDRMFATWEMHADVDAYLWQQNYGRVVHYLGAAHGTVGNIYALLRAFKFLTEDERKTVLDRTVRLLDRLAVHEDGGVNWPAFVGQGPERDLLMHWCHGAPGIIMMLAGTAPKNFDTRFEDLMLRGGEAVWRAGGLKKGASVCHGTAGNGAACLKLFERTGDEMWLERAQVFAMNAIEQLEADEQKYGQLRYSLWTGDLGVALFLRDCVQGRYEMPLLDVV